MITTPLLEEKYKAQRQLNEDSGHDVQKYFELSHKIAADVEAAYGLTFNYGQISGGQLESVAKQTKIA